MTNNTNKEIAKKLSFELIQEVESELEERMGTPFVALTPAFDKEYRKVIKLVIRDLLRDL